MEGDENSTMTYAINKFIKNSEGLLQVNKARKARNHSCLFALCNYKNYEQFVTSKQMEELSGLIAEAKLNADAESTQVKENLLELYKNAFPSAAVPEMISQEWKDLGFQSENPLTDLRSSGKLSLDNILYFSDKHQQLFIDMVKQSTEYPFIASAINITTMLLIHLNICTQYTFCPCCGTSFRSVKKVPLKEMAAFAYLLEDNAWYTVFNEVFSLGVMLMDRNYRKKVISDPTFTILEFRQVFVETKNQIMAVLRKQPYTLYEIFELAKPYLSS